MNKIKEALSDCNQAISFDDTYVEAYLRRAKCYMDLEQYEDAVRDYEKITKMNIGLCNMNMVRGTSLILSVRVSCLINMLHRI